MNILFNQQLCKYVLVFFDDSIIYNKTWDENLHQLDTMLTILDDQSFYVKIYKCEFGMTKILYIGHVIGQQGVKVHI